MDSLGEFFREAREAKDLTIEQVAALTRIREAYLQALEEEYFDLLPQKVFTKGFVRAYARTLELDEEEALRRFSASAGIYYKKEEEEQQQVLQQEEDDRKGKANRNAVVILTGVILIVLVSILPREQSSLSSSQKEVSQSVAETHTKSLDAKIKIAGESEDSQILATEEQDPIPSSEIGEALQRIASESESQIPQTTSSRPFSQSAEVVVERPIVQSTETTFPFESGSEEQGGLLMLEVEALEITWVVVRSDDRTPDEALLQPGERALWRAHDRFLLTLGNAGGVKVTLNGEPQGPFGEHGTVVRALEIKP